MDGCRYWDLNLGPLLQLPPFLDSGLCMIKIYDSETEGKTNN